MFLALARVGVDFNEGEVIVVVEGNPAKEYVEEVAIVSTIVVETEVVFMVGIDLHEDHSDDDDAFPSFKMFLIGS